MGTPLQIDTAVANLTKPNVARQYIAMGLRKKIPNRVWIGHGNGVFWHKVEY